MEFFKEYLFQRPYENSFSEWFLFILLWVITLVCSTLITWGLAFILNFSYRPTQTGKGVITNMNHIYSYYTYTYIGNSAYPDYHPDQYILTVKVNDEYDNVYLSQAVYYTFNIYQDINLSYRRGRLYGGIDIVAIKY